MVHQFGRASTPRSLFYCLFAPQICMVLIFTHIPFVVNHTINATPPERLQQYQHLYKTFCACYYQSALWRQCVLALYGFRVWFKYWKQKTELHSRNRFTGHCTGQVARSTCTPAPLSLLAIPGCSLAHCATVWWPTSRFMVAGTSCMCHSQLFSKKNLWNEKVAKEPQIAKQKFWSQVLLTRAKCLVFGSKRANLATLVIYLGKASRQSAQLEFSKIAHNRKTRQALKRQKGVRATKVSHKTTSTKHN